MPRNYKKRREKITFEALMQVLSTAFAQIADHRRINASYRLADLLRSAFAMFSLKSPSLLSFREQTKVEGRNLQSIYQIGDIPGDTGMRAGLDPVKPKPLRALFAKLFAILVEAGIPMGLAIASVHERRDSFRKMLGRPNRREAASAARRKLRNRLPKGK